MGFISEDSVKPQISVKTKKEKKQPLPSERGCNVCSLKQEWARLTTPRMRMIAGPEADILILGEGPGANEDREGKQFIGDSGQLLRHAIRYKNLDRCAWQNIVRCRPPDNRTPTEAESHACSLYLEEDVARLKPKAILGLGSAPLHHFYSGASITDIHALKFPVRIGDHVCWYYPAFHPAFVLRHRGGANEHVFRANISKFFAEVDTWPKPQIAHFDVKDVIQATSRQQVEDAVARMKNVPLGTDIETEGLIKPYRAGSKLLTAAVSDGDITVAWSINHPENPTSWGWDVLFKTISTRRWVAHNASFELLWFWYLAGLNKWNPGPFEDTMAVARAAHQRHILLGLNHVSRIVLGIDVKSLSNVDVNRLSQTPLTEVLPYNGFDAKACALIYQKLNNKQIKSNVDRMLGSIKSTVAMEIMGLPVDLGVSLDLQQDLVTKIKVNQDYAFSLYETQEFERRYQRPLNIASNIDVGKALVEIARCELPKSKKKTENYITDESILEPLAAENPLARAVLTDRELNKLKGTYIDPLLKKKYHGVDGLIHPTYDCIRVKTGRLASDSPNAQNFPSRKHREVRRQIKPPNGYLVVACDEGQLEARLIAIAAELYTKEKPFCRSIINKEDIHARWRDRALDLNPDYMNVIRAHSGETEEKKLLKAARNEIKNDFVFASLYGSDYKACAARMQFPIKLMEKLQNELWDAYPTVPRWIKEQKQIYEKTGSITLLTGMVRHGYIDGNEFINSPIQGSGSHVVLDAQNELSSIALGENDPNLHPRLNLHDDLTFFLPDKDDILNQYIKRIAKIMTKVRYDWQICPLAVEVKIGYNWADLSEVWVYTGDYINDWEAS